MEARHFHSVNKEEEVHEKRGLGELLQERERIFLHTEVCDVEELEGLFWGRPGPMAKECTDLRGGWRKKGGERGEKSSIFEKEKRRKEKNEREKERERETGRTEPVTRL